MATKGKPTASRGDLSLLGIMAFASASIPIQALVLAVSVHLPRYFASHIGLDLAVVGAAFAMVRLIDIPIDVALGTAMDRTRFYEEKTASQHDVVVWGATSGGIDVYIDPRDYFPFSTESNFAVDWAKFYIKDGGIEPPDYVKQQWALYD